MSRSALEQIYQNQLGRSIGDKGAAYYQGDLDRGQTIDQVRNSISNSAEAKTYRESQQLDQIYQNQLGRSIGEAGSNYYRGDLDAGQTMDQVRNSVMNSEEAKAYRHSTASGLTGAVDEYDRGEQRAEQGLSSAQQNLAPWQAGGQDAFNMQLALTGASGADAQQTAYDNFNSSPGQQFLRDRGEQSVLRNSTAIGGLGGGNVRKELQQFGTGVAAQDFGNHFARLGSLSGYGANAATNQANNNMSAGQWAGGAAQNLGNLRYRVGSDMSNMLQGQQNNLASYQNQLGQAGAGSVGAAGSSLANIISGLGSQLDNSQLSTILANLASGSSSTVAGLPGVGGLVNTPDYMGSYGKIGESAGLFSNAIEDWAQPAAATPAAATPIA